MAIIEDIRINGMQTSQTTNPYIAGLHPVISWDFIQDITSPSQLSFDIKIGSSDSAWGSSSFSGNIVDDSGDTANSYEVLSHNLLRGNTYYGQIRATDENGNFTAWAIFAFITNRLPIVLNQALTANATTSDNVDLTYTYFDADSHDEAGTKIRWYRNGIHQPTYDDLCTLPSTATTSGESWSAKIVPSDGLEYGPVSETLAIVIGESEEGISNVQILPTDANVDDILKVEYDLTESEYIIPTGAAIIEWYVNGLAIPDSNYQYIRLDLDPGDVVTVVVKLSDGDTTFSETTSSPLTISDVDWHVFNLEVSGLTSDNLLSDVSPILNWKILKSTASVNERPDYARVLITKTPSLGGSIFDTGFIEYTKDYYEIPENTLQRGQKYYIHIAVGDSTDIDDSLYITKEVQLTGSSWNLYVDNSTGWTIEFKLSVGLGLPVNTEPEPNMGLYIHDGTYFCAIRLGWRTITFLSGETVTYDIPSSQPDLTVSRSFSISGKGNDVKIFMNNKLIIDISGGFSNESNLKFIEYGDIDGKNDNFGTFRFFRYSTDGAFGFDDILPNENTYYFYSIGKLDGGSIEYINDNLISWLPDDTSESAKLITFNENSDDIILPTVAKNFSPITSIYINENRDKFLGTANGVTAVYGEKHTPDYSLDTSDEDVQIGSNDFDRITNVPNDKLSDAEPDNKDNWFSIDTTYRSVGVVDTSTRIEVDDEYNPYINPIISRAIHYYTQRTHGHAWFDQADNSKGWNIGFSFQLEKLEADDFEETNIDKQGFGIFVNDGTYQEIIYFYEDRIRLFYANIYVPIVTTSERDYVITGKDKNLKIYQKLRSAPANTYRLLVDASGLFVTPSTKTGNSRKPKISIDTVGISHVVWHDDSNKRSQIFYSTNDSAGWTTPELVTPRTEFNMRNPVVDTDSSNRIWCAYEDTSWGLTEISVSVKDSIGWNPKIRLTNYKSDKRNPTIKVDSNDNVHIFWEDNRNGHWNIYWAIWEDSKQAWISSGQFGKDFLAIDNADEDEYQSGSGIDYRKPEVIELNGILWLVYETQFEDNDSAIYAGIRNLGVDFVDESTGEVTGFVTNILISDVNRNCTNPVIASNESRNTFIVVWEDQTESISQIWGAALDSNGNFLVEATQLTNKATNCKSPDVGWASTQCIIVFENSGTISSVSYNPNNQTFIGSALGDSDRLINTSADRTVFNPSLPDSAPSSAFFLVYDFLMERDPYTVSTVEFPEFYMIGDIIVDHEATETFGTTTTTTSTNDETLTPVDTKEFAFGDFSENIGMLAHWRNINMYFGYDAKPYSIAKFNSSTINGWGDDRVNDLFVDVFGNIISATFGGLYYLNIRNNDLTIIDGRNSEFEETDSDGNILSCNSSANSGKCLLNNKIVTTIAWAKGLWYAGTTTGVVYTKTAGKVWEKLDSTNLGNLVVNKIVSDANGNAIIATNSGIYIAHPDRETVKINSLPDNRITSIAIDENNVIWAGSDSGLYRIENQVNILSFNTNQGMRTAQINDIAIVNKNLRYIATASGIERMYGMKFTNFNVNNLALINDNISSIQWDNNTNSLWVGSFDTLHEIVFRDPIHDIIENEVVQYDATEITTEESYDKDLYSILDLNRLNTNSGEDLDITNESISVFINKNKLDFGFTIGTGGESIVFLTNLLETDQVEVSVTNRFLEFYDFNQSNIEISVRGLQRRSIEKLERTSKRQLLLLSGLDKPSILLFSEESLGLPFTTILLDRDLPVGCLEKIETLTRTTLRFRILAFDNLSGLDGYILSNYENFTTDGETPQEFLPFQSVVEHDIGSGINNVIESLTIPSTDTIDSNTIDVGNGSALATFIDTSTSENIKYLIAATSSPAIVYKFNPATSIWTAIQDIDSLDSNRSVTGMKTINNVVFMTTGTTSSGGYGGVYRSVDGISFELIGSVTGSSSKGIAVGPDGTVYFGSSDGSIYTYKDGVFTKPDEFSSVAQTINSLDIYNNILVVGTGDLGRVYTIDITTNDNLIIFSGPDTQVENVHIKDAEIASTPSDAELFVSSSGSTTIYRTDMESFDFVKSYASFNKNINKIISVNKSVLEEPGAEVESGSTTLASIGDSLFKHIRPSWEFVYKHNEEINDFVEYETNGVNGIWIISDSKITKWTAVLATKTVYLKLKDKAGNVSSLPSSTDCPNDETTVCCDYAYSINISDLKDFVNENRIVDVDEYGAIQFTFDSPNQRSFYSADQIDEEIGIYTSEIFNGSNDLVSWKTLTWDSTEPSGTSVDLQIRSGSSEDALEDKDWSANLVKNSSGFVVIEHITDQYVQFRALLKSQVRSLSPTLTSVTIRNITAQASHFFTTNFALPSRPIKGILTANTFIPISADIVFGVNTNDSVDFGDYQIIEPNRLFTTAQGQFGENLRVGAKLLSPGIPQLQASSNPGDPYDASSFICSVEFDYQNINASTTTYHFRVRFYNDPYRTQLIHTFYSGNDQTGWEVSNGGDNIFPSLGVEFSASQTKNITFTPGDLVEQNQRWYITVQAIDTNDTTTVDTISDNQSFICSACNITNEDGLVGEFYSGLSSPTEIPDFGDLTPDRILIDDDINFTETTGNWTTSQGVDLGSSFVDDFAIRWRGKIQAPTTGEYTFGLTSNDGSKLFINQTKIIDHDGLHDYTQEQGTIELAAGFHDIEIQFFAGNDEAGIKFEWAQPGESTLSVVPTNRLFHAVANEYCDDVDSPRLLNFAILFELENGETVKINLDT